MKNLINSIDGYYARYAKVGNLVNVQIYCSFCSSDSEYVDAGLNLPVGYRPSKYFFQPCFDDITSRMYALVINTNGSIKPYNINPGQTTHILATFSFLVE